MSYRGKKYLARVRALEKQNLVQEKPFSGIHNRGIGGKHRCFNKREEKRCIEQEERERISFELSQKAALLWREALHVSPGHCDKVVELMGQVEELQCRAQKVLESKKVLEADIWDVPICSWSSPNVLASRCPDPLSTALVEAIRSGERNFMNGISYRVNPLDTLKMISASSIFGEPQYYRDGESAKKTILDGTYGIDRLFAEYSLRMLDPYKGMKTSQVMEKAIDDALTYNFEATLLWAVELRKQYLMRLNPQVILVRAALHPGREAYTRTHPGKFASIAQQVMPRGDDVINQVQYYLAQNGSKKGIPALLKRSWAKRISTMDAYSMAKYGNTGIGLVDVVRICHAKGKLVDTLMQQGKVPMPEGENTWERLRASGMSWQDILKEIRMPHMALLRNLRGIFTEVQDPAIRNKTLELLKQGVRRGKQFPFRYLSAWKAVEKEGKPWACQVKKALEECMGISCANLPSLEGRCAFLSDNSGSAWGICTSEWGTMQVAEIGNLSSVIGAMCADEGVVFPFGDKLKSVPIRKDEGVLRQAHRVSVVGKSCGHATENGIWLFFRNAIMYRQHWDNIFMYSDMQAGHGGLYGIRPEDYEVLGAQVNGSYIDVNMLVKLYREQVNPKVNVFCIQTAGYSNVLVPEYGYRSAILYGWTGKELLFADAMNRIWNELESREPKEQ